ncbi:MAG: hypothetical protein RR623_07940 [Bacilli bacterium]
MNGTEKATVVENKDIINGTCSFGNWVKYSDGTVIINGKVEIPKNTGEHTYNLPFNMKNTVGILTNIYSNSKNVGWSFGSNLNTFTVLSSIANDGTLPTFATNANVIIIGTIA